MDAANRDRERYRDSALERRARLWRLMHSRIIGDKTPTPPLSGKALVWKALRFVSELPLLGSNQDSPDPESATALG